MKKLLCLLLVLSMLFALAACKGKETIAPVETEPTTTNEPTEDDKTEPTEPEKPTTPDLPDEYKPDVVVGLLLNGDDIVYEKDNIKISLKNYNMQEYKDILEFCIKNDSDKKIVFACNYAVVNGMTITCMNDLNVISEKSENNVLIEATHERRKEICKDINDLKYLELSFCILECASDEYQDFSGVLVNNGVAVFKDKEYNKNDYAMLQNGDLVYEDNQVAIYMEKDCNPELFYEFFPYTIVNKTGKPIVAGMDMCKYSSDLATWYEKDSGCIDAERIIAPNSFAVGRLKVNTAKMEHLLTAVFTLKGYENTGIEYIYPTSSYKTIECNGKTFKITFPSEGDLIPDDLKGNQ